MRSLFSAIIFGFLITSSLASASTNGDAQIERFQVWIRELREVLTSSTDTRVVARALVSGTARNATFHLQGLGRIYEKVDPKFKTLIRDDLKELEDAIGEYDKWNSIDKSKVGKAESTLVKILEKEGWSKKGVSTHLDAIEKFIKEFRWPDYETDRKHVLLSLGEQLDHLSSTNYDLTRLEKTDGDGNGLHELRREMRWFLIEARVLNGLLNYAPGNACSAPAYASLLDSKLVDHKYATLASSPLEVDPCLVERCLVLGLVKSVNIMGGLKDAAEEDRAARQADRVPDAMVAEATGIYNELKETQVFSRLSQNIRSCQR